MILEREVRALTLWPRGCAESNVRAGVDTSADRTCQSRLDQTGPSTPTGMLGGNGRPNIDAMKAGLRGQIDKLKGWLRENAEVQQSALPEALPELERERKMLERALAATRERLRDPFAEAVERSRGRIRTDPVNH